MEAGLSQQAAPVEKSKEKKLKEVKAYKKKIKRHSDAILAIQSVDGIKGNLLISGSADHTVRSK